MRLNKPRSWRARFRQNVLQMKFQAFKRNSKRLTLLFKALKVDEVKPWRRKPLDKKMNCYLPPTTTAQRLCNRLILPVSTSGFSWKVHRNCAFCLSTENTKVMTKNDVDLNH